MDKSHTLTIEGISDETLQKLQERADGRKESLDEYLRLQLTSMANGVWRSGTMTAHESMERARARLKEEPSSVSPEMIVEAIHQDRR